MPLIRTEKPANRVRNRSLKDYAGKRFGRLVGVSLVERDTTAENNHVWRFLCDCGSLVERRIKVVRGGHTSSCGCFARDALTMRNTSHGLTRTQAKTYRSWKDMRGRCRNPSDSDFKDYGGRGIKVCARWDNFAAFFEDMGARPEGMTLDRIDTNGDYEPGNCRWANARTQANNKRTNRRVSINGATATLQQMADEHGIDRSKARYRLDAGYDPEEAFKPGDLRRGGA